MSTNDIYASMVQHQQQGRKSFGLLIDPDKEDGSGLGLRIELAVKVGVDYFFVGGSHLSNNHLQQCVTLLKQSSIPVILFPGNASQISPLADGILLLSLISGRNADLLIGQHVQAAMELRNSGLQLLPTGYILVDGGKATSVNTVSATQPIAANGHSLAVQTALAGQQLGLKLIYLEAGSGAINPVPVEMIKAVRNEIGLPLIVGGGIDTEQKAINACNAGADLIVVGNAIEQNRLLIETMCTAVHGCNLNVLA